MRERHFARNAAEISKAGPRRSRCRCGQSAPVRRGPAPRAARLFRSPWGAKRSVAHSEAKLAQREPADVDDVGRLEIPATASLQHKHR